MSFKINMLVACIGLLGLASVTGNAEVIFSDSFESGDMSATNSYGFAWGSNNLTSVVTMNPQCGGFSIGDPTAIWNNGSICNPLTPAGGGDLAAKDGNNSLRFRYHANNSWTEQRYDMGAGYPELWVSYWIRVPMNYSRGTINTSKGNNNKWFDILMAPMTSYSDPTVSRIEMQDWPNDGGVANGMQMLIQFRNGSDGLFKNSVPYTDFVIPADSGKWMHVIYYLKSSATTSSTDGIIRLYRRWESESGYTLINELADINVGIGAGSVSAGYAGWGAGYIMGYYNMPYEEETDWLVDSFTVSNTSLLPPKPPGNITVK